MRGALGITPPHFRYSQRFAPRASSTGKQPLSFKWIGSQWGQGRRFDDSQRNMIACVSAQQPQKGSRLVNCPSTRRKRAERVTRQGASPPATRPSERRSAVVWVRHLTSREMSRSDAVGPELVASGVLPYKEVVGEVTSCPPAHVREPRRRGWNYSF